ncbi:MAG: oligosaccharide flippase family protein [Patescibacteria group bacterium]
MFAEFKDNLHSAIKWSEKYAKTDMVYVTEGGLWLTVAKGVGMVVSLLLATAVANLVSPEVFGTYRFVISGAAIISAFSLAGIGVAITQAVARGYEGALRRGVREYLKWSFGVIGVSLAVAAYYFLNDNYVLGISFVIVAACHPLLTGFSFSAQFTSGKKDFKTHAVFDMARNAVPAVILIATLFVTDNPVLIVLAYFLSSVAIALLLYYATLWKFKPNDMTDPQTISYSQHLSVLGMLGKIAEHIDKVLIFHYLGAAQLAVYAFALTPINQLKLLNDIPAKLAVPKLTQRPLGELRRSLPGKILMLIGIMTCLAGTYIVFAPTVFRFLFPQYLNAVLFSQIAALSLIFLPGSMFGEALTAHMRKKELYVSQTILPLSKIGLYFLLLPPFGVWGAIVATVVSQGLQLTVQGIQFWRASR